MSDRAARIRGGLWGLLIGDALGVPYEFHRPEALPEKKYIEFDPPNDFSRTHARTPSGTWSDDGAQALCLLESLLEKQRLDPDDLIRRLADWYEHGHWAVDGRVFDVGIQTSDSIHRALAGTPSRECGGTDEMSNGNGSLMRVLPLALWHRGSNEELVRDAFLQSEVTHAHPRAKVCCAIYCLWARGVLNGDNAPWPRAIKTIRQLYNPGSSEREELETHIRPDEEATPHGTGYVVDCLHSARHVTEQESFEEVVKHAILLGNDTDTTAAVAGGIAGIQYGLLNIPERWRSALRGQDLFIPLLERLVDSK